MRLRTRPVIEFLCRPEDQGVIAEPVRAMKILPAWFKQLPGVDKAHVTATNCLFLPPLNRPDPVVEVFAGVVDTDTYRAPINFPFVATAADGVYTLEKGMPLVQVIPFRRVDAAIGGSVRAETPTERDERIQIARSTQAGAGWYRRHARASRQEVTPAGSR
jgi:hypothetical protein